jgi:hypothetical protein
MALFVTVQPGITVDSETVLDASALNRLGTPTVDVTGTLDGDSQITIDANSVENSMLKNMAGPSVKGRESATPGVPTDITIDDSTLEIDSGDLHVKDAGITAAKMAASSVTDASIDNLAISLAKLKTQVAATINGNPTASGGAASPMEAILVGTGLALSGVSSQTITYYTRTGTTVTVTIAEHGYLTGDVVNVTGTDVDAYQAAVTTTSSATFTYDTESSGTANGSGGSVRKVKSEAGVPAATLSGFGDMKMVGFKIKTDQQTFASVTQATAITGLTSDEITPTSSASKFMLVAGITGTTTNSKLKFGLLFQRIISGENDYQTVPGSVATGAGTRTVASAMIGRGSNERSNRSVTMAYYDSPDTALGTTYRVAVVATGGVSVDINSASTDDADADNSTNIRTVSWLAIFEVQ